MKIRLTIMTENDKPIDDKYSTEEVEEKTKKAWDFVLNLLAQNGEKVIVEKCELVDRGSKE